MAWQFAARDEQRRQARERIALRVTAASFFALAAFLTADSLRSLIDGNEAGHSTVGIALAAASLTVMPVLSLAQRRVGHQLASASAGADSHQTLLCTYLSGVLLLGLLVNSMLGWWWADPVAALTTAVVAVREGRQAWRGDTCCVPTGLAERAGLKKSHHDWAAACGAGCACCT